MTVHVEIPGKMISDFCRRWEITEMALFGSILQKSFQPGSDVDVLVRFNPEAKHSLFDMVRMQDELKEIFGREVDLVSRSGLESSRNHLRRKAIIESAEVIYAA